MRFSKLLVINVAILFLFIIIQNIFPQDSVIDVTPLYDLKLRTGTVPLDNKEEFITWSLKNVNPDKNMTSLRWDRTKACIRIKDLTNKRVVEAFLRTPRENFVRKYNLKRAYASEAMGIGHGVTISGPHMVARMTDVLNPDIDHKILEIGTGSGYQSAMLAELSNYVYTIEIIEPLAKETDDLYKGLESNYPQYKNIHRKIGDGYFGWEEYAPFERIIVTCSIDHIPPPLLDQLKPDGMMVIPVGPPNAQILLKVTKKVAKDGTVTYDRQDVYNGKLTVIFVPFTADKGKSKHSIKRDNPAK